ncbi:MAG: cytochrome c [Bacteroidia bacterium]
MDTGMLHTHNLVVSLYLLQLLVRVVMMIAASKTAVDKYVKAMRIPHIVLSILMVATGTFLMFRAPGGVQPYILVKLGLVLASIPLGVIGSKRNSVALTGFAFVLLAGTMALAYAKPAFLRNTSSTAASAKEGLDPAKIKAGQPLYEQRCTLCHGNDGAAGFQKAADLSTSKMADADMLNIIKNGKGVMPDNSDLSAEQLDQVKEYVKNLRK